MNFGEPWRLWALAGVAMFALILIFFAMGQRSRAGSGVRWPRIARVVATGTSVRPVRAGRTVRRPWFLLLATTGVILALAHPRWGTIDEPVVEQSREVMIALDLSRSMLVEDVPPSRLERAKLLTKSLIDGLRGERVGIIVFAGTAFIQVPMSADYQIIHDFLPELKPDYMPQGGTDYDGMLRAALGGFGSEANVDRFLIVLSDGESHSADWREHLPELRERGVRTLTLGIGTPKGGFIPDGKQGYLKDERGAVVLSKLEPATLQALASETRGVFRNASEWLDLPALLEATVARSRAGRFETRRNVRYIERFQWFLAPAVALALVGLWREIAVRPRQHTVRRAAPASTLPKSVLTTAAALALSLLGPPQAPAAEIPPKSTEPDARVRETISRLSATNAPTARDWRELADRTLVYATGARMNQQTVETGAVYDALDAVDRGERADPKLTDWKKLRDDLRATLDLPPQQEKPEEPPPEEKQEEEKDQQQDQQNQSQDQSQPQSSDPQNKNQQQNEKQQQQQQQENEPQKSEAQQPPPPQEGSMGEMKPDAGEPPPTPPREESSANPPKTRKIGAKPETAQPPPADAETAVLLQRLRQAAEKDSPARLFELIEGEEKQPAERGRDW